MTPYTAGYFDAQRGHTACPFGLPDVCSQWSKGYDRADEEGLAQFPRFGKLRRKR